MARGCFESVAESCLAKSCIGPSRMNARYIYAIIFLLTTVVAWMIRDYSHDALASLHYLKGCQGGHDCLGSEGVLRVSLGCFVFFFTMYLTTVGTSKPDDPRDAWHSGWWPIKSLFWIIVMVLPFFIPSAFIQMYGEMARFGAGIFLVIQLLSVINFIYWWNEEWLSEHNVRRCQIPLVVIAVGSYILSFIGIILMYVWFSPRASCGVNIFFITWTFVLILVVTAISLHSKVNAGLLTSGLISLYLVFLCWSAIMSEPASELCNTRSRQTGKADWLTVLSFLIAFFAIILATFSTGIDSKSLALPHSEEETSENDIPYSYGFFHFVFAMGAMYFAMLFVGWNLHQTMHRWSIDVGWASVWVKVINEWLAAAVYIWTMVCVFVLKGRDFS
ncbi:probable serine incorporator [Selaginella moellendorffii]|nr:probable serine incorporator isoform X2 [Selaginella moellendorffii]XP_002983103.2 probable serine incorporator [Selaginella moellendorffii]XP_024543926.1 probable serine incorporator [Selaginella moellendorffii]|eukprot:XP_002965853.2 probable serine incorporator isoform X2 [Selaginella moellendorffii]